MIRKDDISVEHNYYLAHYGVKGMKWRRHKSTYNNETFEDRFRRESLEIEKKNKKRIKDNIDKKRFNKKWNEDDVILKYADVIINSANTIPLIKKGKDLFKLNAQIVTGLMATTINTARRALFNFFKRR